MEQPLPDTPALSEEGGEANTCTSPEFDAQPKSDGDLSGPVPDKTVVFAAESPEANQTLGNFAKRLSNSPPYHFKVEGCSRYAYALAEGDELPADLDLPDGIELLSGHSSGQPPLTEPLPNLVLAELPLRNAPHIDPVIIGNPLAQHSLRGMAGHYAKAAVKARPILGPICLAGQATAIYAPPNAGKTLITIKLILDAAQQKQINVENVYYINADDSSEGLATKLGIMDDFGCHTLAPGQRNFDPSKLADLLNSMARDGKAKGAIIIIDTLKKVTNLMDKSKAAAFTTAGRNAVMAGATLVGFAHTNKAVRPDGKPVYGGTSDVRDDFDAVYLAYPIDASGFEGEKVVAFECIKSRGSNPQKVHYAYTNAEGISYEERLASVRLVDEQEWQGFQKIEQERSEADLVAAIEALIREGEFSKMALAKAASLRTGVSERASIRLIEKYSGTDPETAKWRFTRKSRGAMVYSLLPASQPSAGDG